MVPEGGGGGGGGPPTESKFNFLTIDTKYNWCLGQVN